MYSGNVMPANSHSTQIKVAFRSCVPVPDTSLPPDTASTATCQPPTSLLQPHGHWTELTLTPAVTQSLPPPRPELMSQEDTYQEGAPPLLQTSLRQSGHKWPSAYREPPPCSCSLAKTHPPMRRPVLPRGRGVLSKWRHG